MAISLVVVSPSGALGAALAQALSAARFRVVAARPGPAVLRAVHEERPRVVVLDRVNERPEAAQLEVALLKELCPGVPVIALSSDSTERDAQIVEQGIFYYLAGASLSELVRIIDAAEQTAGWRDGRPSRSGASVAAPPVPTAGEQTP